MVCPIVDGGSRTRAGTLADPVTGTTNTMFA